MTTNGILSFLVSLSIRSQVALSSQPTWTFSLQVLTLSALLRLRGWYKFVCRLVTGCGAIGRLCQTALGDSALLIDEKGMEFRGTEMRRLVWRIDCELRLSATLSSEYASIAGTGEELLDSKESTMSLVERSGRKLALDIRVKKQIDAVHQPMLSDIITTLISIEMGKCLLLRESQEEVKPEQHQVLLEEIWAAVNDFGVHSDTQSELTLLDEKDFEKIDWVKLGFQGKSPETDFRATGVLGLAQLHSFCTIYPVLTQRIVQESGSSSTLDITEPWYPFALMGIHLTDAILKTLSAGLLQETIIMKLQGNAYNSISRICQDLFDRSVEEFHAYWRDLVRKGAIKNVFDFERVFREFKRQRGLL